MILKLDIAVFQQDLLFSPIRDKFDISCLLLECIKIMSIPPFLIPDQQKYGELIFVKKGRMNRIFLVSSKKIVSIGCPFFSSVNKISEEMSVLDFYWGEHYFVDSKLTSIGLNLLRGGYLNRDLKFDMFFDYMLEQEVDFDIFWDFIKIILSAECGYIRYDNDPDPSRLKESPDKGFAHPLHHFDLFYSSHNGVKFGLYQEINFDKFLNILNLDTDCHYLDGRAEYK